MNIEKEKLEIQKIWDKVRILQEKASARSKSLEEYLKNQIKDKEISLEESFTSLVHGYELYYRKFHENLDKLNSTLPEKTKFHAMGHNPSTNQNCIYIKIGVGASDSDLAIFEKEVNKIFNILKPLTDKDCDLYTKVKKIDIFEHTLCKDGCYTLLQIKKEKYAIMLTRYHRESIVFESDNIFDCLKEIREKYWYKF